MAKAFAGDFECSLLSCQKTIEVSCLGNQRTYVHRVISQEESIGLEERWRISSSLKCRGIAIA